MVLLTDKDIDKLFDQYPEEPALLQQQGELLRKSGEREAAIQKLDAAGELYLRAGDRYSAALVIRSILAMEPPNSAQYRQLLAQLQATS